MTSKVAFQAVKRRKMGYDVDFLDDSGVPMDGIELDSSSSSTATAAVTRGTSSPSLPRPSGILNSTMNSVSNSRHSNGPTKINHNHNIASTTNSETTPANSSTPDQQQQQQQALNSQQKQQQQQPHQKTTTTNLLMNMTDNEAMTKDDEDPSMLSYINDDAELKFSSHNSPDFGQALNDYRMLDEMFPFPDKGQQSSSTNNNANNANSNNHLTNNCSGAGGSNNSSSQKSIVRSFGDLFDDDDLD